MTQVPSDQLHELRTLVAKAEELRSEARELVSSLERNAAQLAEVRKELLEAALCSDLDRMTDP